MCSLSPSLRSDYMDSKLTVSSRHADACRTLSVAGAAQAAITFEDKPSQTRTDHLDTPIS